MQIFGDLNSGNCLTVKYAAVSRGFDLTSRPRVQNWIRRCEEALHLQPAS